MAENDVAVSPLAAGLKCRCPRCGRGHLFSRLLTVAAECDHCGLDLRAEDSGDGPAVFVILIVGALAVAILLVVEKLFTPPMWLHLIYLVPLILGLSIVLLRPFKAILIALQYHNKMGGLGDDQDN